MTDAQLAQLIAAVSGLSSHIDAILGAVVGMSMALIFAVTWKG